MNTTNSTTTQHEFVWPLPATQLSNAHLTWGEWVARQAATISSEQYAALAAPAQALPAEQSSASYLGRDTTTHLVWPLPPTQLPSARLTWDEWVAVWANGAAVRQPEHAAFQRVA
jgi:hypothetical protein